MKPCIAELISMAHVSAVGMTLSMAKSKARAVPHHQISSDRLPVYRDEFHVGTVTHSTEEEVGHDVSLLLLPWDLVSTMCKNS